MEVDRDVSFKMFTFDQFYTRSARIA